ncbi:hypothetical protein ABT304_08655 [Nocardioides sp. NPDC000445]|uniref:YobI family P-loop NTPase n=1 Tax=Nocardioides sp. NPDC000445 TaxID=3154257 RepID=UPI0033186F9B
MGNLLSKWGTKLVGDTAATPPALRELTADFDDEQHGIYVAHLQQAVTNPKLRNIALTGGYGTGKSSILTRFVELQQEKAPDSVVELTLATIGINGIAAASGDGEPEKSEPEKPNPSDPALSKTNRIERELVKQLLYSSPPKYGSRFQRIRPLGWRKACWRAFLVAGAAVGALRLFDVAPARFPGLPDDVLWTWHLVALATLSAAVVFAGAWLQRVLNGRFSIQNVRVGSATVSLGEKSSSYFDKYLDEIIHFFTQGDVRVVVLEDVDRFNDSHIFEELRELNTLINRAEELKSDPVRFVYALKDSIFKQLGRDEHAHPSDAPDDLAAEGEALLGSRTKFFDLVIPVVPFITPRSSRDLLKGLLKKTSAPNVSETLVSLVARRLPDMRLLKNICNEYEVFADRLLPTQADGTPSPLEPDKLFAMVVFKNIRLEEFEKVARGTSVLDQIYTSSRGAVRHNLAYNEEKIRNARQALNNIVNQADAERMGGRLTWFISQMIERSPGAGLRATGLQVGGTPFGTDAVGTQEFWAAVAASPSVTVMVLRHNPFTISDAQLRELLGSDLNPDAWRQSNEEALEAELAQLTQKSEGLRSSDFAELAVDVVLLNPKKHELGSFRKMLTEKLGLGLALELALEGYIDQNFALYAGQFYGEFLSKNVMNFIVRQVQPGEPDFDYTFTSEEAEALLGELGTGFLGEPASFNKSLLDHLFDVGDERASQLLAPAMSKTSKGGTGFLKLYLQESSKRDELATRLAAGWSETFNLLLVLTELADADRLTVVDAALSRVDRALDYTHLPQLRDYVREHASVLTSLTGPLPEGQAEKLADVLVKAGNVFDDLNVLHETLREEIVTRDAYALTPTNLRAALGGITNFPLDVVRATNDTVFQRCVANAAEYLAAFTKDKATSATVSASEAFADVLHAVAAWEEPQIRELVANAAPTCLVESLADVPMETWPSLALEKRFPTTLANIQAYIGISANQVDDDLAVPLAETKKIEPRESDSDDVKRPVATAVLRATEHLDAKKRVTLTESLELSEYIPATEIPDEKGSLLGLLLEHDLVEDTADIFAHFAGQDWATVEGGIAASKRFGEFVSPTVLPENLVANFLTSEKLDRQLRVRVLLRFDEFAPTGDPRTLTAAAQLALTAEVEMPITFLHRLADTTKDAEVVVPLLVLAPNVPASELRDVLARLDGKYSGFAGAAGTKISLPDNPGHRALADRLRKAGVTGKPTPTRKLLPGRMNVTLR